VARKGNPREPAGARERSARGRDRSATARARTAIPPPLPPETRTVGQLVAETLRLYARRPWRSLALGVAVAVIDIAAISFNQTNAIIFEAIVAGPLLSVSYVGACLLAAEDRARPPARTLAEAWLAGTIAFLPFPVLAFAFILPAVAWLALVGLVVPVIVLERMSIGAAFRRAVQLARADYVHALGSLATLAITYFVARLGLFFLLRGGSGAAERTAAFLADLVISPLLFLGAALLYYDQRARVGSAPRPRRRDADVHPVVQSDRSGRADAEGESSPATRGEQ
jgi:hypothetical protein